jgi:hypothetical protein
MAKTAFDPLRTLGPSWKIAAMSEHDVEAEASFFERFDCRFPYAEREAASALIREGFKISPNGAFGVLEEICRPPKSATVSPSRLAELLDEWRQAAGTDFHPLAEPIIKFAAATLEDVHPPIEDRLRLMETIGRYPGQRAALNITVMTAYPDDEEERRRVDELDSEIRGRWDRMGV